MASQRPLSIRAARGFQHAQDEYYYRPLVAGERLFTYVAHVRAGGDMAPSVEEAKMFELSLFMLDGELNATLGEEQVVLRPGDGLHIPLNVPFGVRNSTSRSASFVLSFSPPPPLGSLEAMFEQARAKGRRVFEPKEFDAIIGETEFPLR